MLLVVEDLVYLLHTTFFYAPTCFPVSIVPHLLPFAIASLKMTTISPEANEEVLRLLRDILDAGHHKHPASELFGSALSAQINPVAPDIIQAILHGVISGQFIGNSLQKSSLVIVRLINIVGFTPTSQNISICLEPLGISSDSSIMSIWAEYVSSYLSFRITII